MRRWLALVVLVTAAMVAAACSGNADTKTEEQATITSSEQISRTLRRLIAEIQASGGCVAVTRDSQTHEFTAKPCERH